MIKHWDIDAVYGYSLQGRMSWEAINAALEFNSDEITDGERFRLEIVIRDSYKLLKEKPEHTLSIVRTLEDWGKHIEGKENKNLFRDYISSVYTQFRRASNYGQ